MTCELDLRNNGDQSVKRLIWLTDLHLDALDKSQYNTFFGLVAAYEPDIVLIGGDICNGVASLSHLTHLAELIKRQIYFVLGNHDFYYGSIRKNRASAKALSDEIPAIHYLTGNGVIPLSGHTALIGHDGWSDGRAGDFFRSSVTLNDYFYIDELKDITPKERLQKLNALGSEAASFLRNQLLESFKSYERVILLTHVPPFEEACLHGSLPCDADWAPHFVGKATGDVLEELMKKFPEKQLLVLCGHSHSAQDVNILPNLRVITGQSELGTPHVQGVIIVNQ